MEQNKATIGMTSAISLAGPKEADLKLSESLKATLWESGMFETEAELNFRQVSLNK